MKALGGLGQHHHAGPHVVHEEPRLAQDRPNDGERLDAHELGVRELGQGCADVRRDRRECREGAVRSAHEGAQLRSHRGHLLRHPGQGVQGRAQPGAWVREVAGHVIHTQHQLGQRADERVEVLAPARQGRPALVQRALRR